MSENHSSGTFQKKSLLPRGHVQYDVALIRLRQSFIPASFLDKGWALSQAEACFSWKYCHQRAAKQRRITRAFASARVSLGNDHYSRSAMSSSAVATVNLTSTSRSKSLAGTADVSPPCLKPAEESNVGADGANKEHTLKVRAHSIFAGGEERRNFKISSCILSVQLVASSFPL